MSIAEEKRYYLFCDSYQLGKVLGDEDRFVSHCRTDCNIPYESREEVVEDMAENWWEVVKIRDKTYDLCAHCYEEYKKFVKQKQLTVMEKYFKGEELEDDHN